jgi:iron complex outermembrane receptor protein
MTTVTINDDLLFKNIVGYQRSIAEGSNDQDGMPVPIILFGLPIGKPGISETISNEAQFQGDFLDGRLKTVAGVYTSWTNPVREGAGTVSIVFAPFSALRAGGGTTDASSIAPFGQGTLALDFISDKLTLTAGARYTTDKRTQNSFTIAQRTAANPTGAVITCTITDCTLVGGTRVNSTISGSWKGWNYAVSFDYKANDNLLFYAAHRHGFKGGQFNANVINPADRVVRPEYVDDVEAGLKSDWTVGSMRGRTNFALYYSWWTDIVQTTYDVQTATTFSKNVAKATVNGGELEVTVFPAAGLELSAFYSFTMGLFRETKATSPSGQPIPFPITRFGDVPVHRINGSARYELPIEAKIAVGGGISYQSSRYLNQNATYVAGKLPGYVLVNVQADWKEAMGTNLDLTLYVKNLFDKAFFHGGAELYADIGFNAGIMGDPRTFGIQAKYTF